MTGEADVEFATHEDAVAAMSKDKANMRKYGCWSRGSTKLQDWIVLCLLQAECQVFRCSLAVSLV